MSEPRDLEGSLKGKTVLRTSWDADTVTFETDRETVVWEVEADCCSRSWVESADLPLGTVVSVSDIDAPLPGNVEADPNKYDVVQYYGIKIVTDKGDGTIEFRNDSNGYYGGSMSVRRT